MLFLVLLRRVRRFRNDVSGATAIFIALATAVFAASAGFVVDSGHLYYQKRRLQTAADLAALTAVSDLARANDAAAASLAQNGYARENIESLQPGAYTSSLSLAPDARFVAGGAPSNAARIQLTSNASLMMAPVMNVFRQRGGAQQAGAAMIRARATAASENRAAFSVGSRLLALDGGVLNGLLGGLLGSKVSLSVMDYNALANSKINLFEFSDVLATRLSLTAVSYDELLATEVRLSDVFAAASEMSSGDDRQALYALSQDTAAASKLKLRDVFSPGAYGLRGTADRPALALDLSALELVSLSALAANGNRQVGAGLQIGLPPVASVSLRLGVGERPVNSASVVAGAVGATAHTAQTRLLLTVDLVGSGNLALVKLPLYIEIASATARLKSVSCPGGDRSRAQVTLGVRPAIIDAWIGAVSVADFDNQKTSPSPSPAKLVNILGLASISARAHVTLSNASEKDVEFSAADIGKGVHKTVSTSDFTTSLMDGLLRDLELDVNALGILNLGLGDLGKSLASLLAAATPAVDQILASALGLLGVSLGEADVRVSDVACGTPVLVN